MRARTIGSGLERFALFLRSQFHTELIDTLSESAICWSVIPRSFLTFLSANTGSSLRGVPMRSEYAHTQSSAQDQRLAPLHKCQKHRDIMRAMSTTKRRRGQGLTADESERFRTILLEMGHNQTALGAMSGMDPSTYSRFLAPHGTHGSRDMVDALSHGLGINLWELIKMKPKADTPNFVAAVESLKSAVGPEAIARVRLLLRLPDNMADAPVEWWIAELVAEQQRVQRRATLEPLLKPVGRVKK